jgi:hypothetical protein
MYIIDIKFYENDSKIIYGAVIAPINIYVDPWK